MPPLGKNFLLMEDFLKLGKKFQNVGKNLLTTEFSALDEIPTSWKTFFLVPDFLFLQYFILKRKIFSISQDSRHIIRIIHLVKSNVSKTYKMLKIFKTFSSYSTKFFQKQLTFFLFLLRALGIVNFGLGFDWVFRIAATVHFFFRYNLFERFIYRYLLRQITDSLWCFCWIIVCRSRGWCRVRGGLGFYDVRQDRCSVELVWNEVSFITDTIIFIWLSHHHEPSNTPQQSLEFRKVCSRWSRAKSVSLLEVHILAEEFSLCTHAVSTADTSNL